MKSLRKWFFLAVSLIIGILALVRFLLFQTVPDMPSWRSTLAAILDNLLAAALTSFAIGIAYAIFVPEGERSQVELIPSRDIPTLLRNSASTSDRWDVRARTASYFSRVTLPLLRDNALTRGGTVTVRIAVIDPRDPEVMQAYARYRSNHAGAGWTPQRARVEVLSTILAAAVFRSEAPRLDIEVGLSSAFWLLSLDITDEMVLVTGQNKGEPALCVRRTSELYMAWRDEFAATYERSEIIRPHIGGITLEKLRRPSDETRGKVAQLFSDIDLDTTEEEVNSAMHYLDRKHNYE